MLESSRPQFDSTDYLARTSRSETPLLSTNQPDQCALEFFDIDDVLPDIVEYQRFAELAFHRQGPGASVGRPKLNHDTASHTLTLPR